jgi:hypothetical protein
LVPRRLGSNFPTGNMVNGTTVPSERLLKPPRKAGIEVP